MSNDLKEKSVNSFAWKTAQSICSLGTTFIVQLILARIIAPEDFGIISISTVFMTLANTIIETSFSSTIIQRPSLDQKLISSVFYANLLLSLGVYVVLLIIAPVTAMFYEKPIINIVLSVQGLRVIISAFYSVHQALLIREMKYKVLFFCSLIGSVFQLSVGIAMAYMGCGIWALVVPTLASSIITGTAIAIWSKWRPIKFFSYKLIKDALSFSSKILAIRVTRKLYYNIRMLAIGKVYDTETLGFFDKGFQFPSTAMNVIDGSLTSVAFTSLSKLQNDKEKLCSLLRHYVRIMMFVCTPLLAGMALVAKPMVIVLLGEKWLECVPFLQIVCFTQMLLPLNVKTTAFEALGESGVSMKLHISSIILSIVLLLLCIPFPAWIMVLSGLVSSIILQIIIAFYSIKMLNYKIADQLKDCFCGIIPAAGMTAVVLAVTYIDCGNVMKLCLGIFTGILSFVLISILTKNKVFFTIYNMLAEYKKSKHKKHEKV